MKARVPRVLGSRRQVIVHVGPERVALGRADAGGVRWVDERSSAGLPWEDLLDLMLARPEARQARAARVVLPPPWTQLRTLKGLPPVPEHELGTLVSSHVRRFFRCGPEPLVVDAVWQGPRTAKDPRARAAACPVDVLERVEQAVARAGLVLSGVSPALEDPDGRITLQSPGLRHERSRRARGAVLKSAAIACGTWALAASVYGADLWADARAIRTEREALQASLLRVDAVRQRLTEHGPTMRLARAQGPEGAWAERTLALLAASLPETATIMSLDAGRTGSLSLTLQGSDPIEVVQQLTTSGLPVLAMGAQPTPVPNTEPPQYRFSLSAEPRP